MHRPISTFPLNEIGLKKLLQNGYLYEEDLYENQKISPKVIQLLTRTNNSLESVTSSKIEVLSALDVWQDEVNLPRIVSLSRSLDTLLGGGFPCGKIVELFGSPGSGKTQICLQLCISVQIPKCLGGLEGEAIYIDTDHGFSLSRIEEMSKSCVDLLKEHLSDILKESWTNNFLLSGIRHIHVATIPELFACIFRLNDLLKSESKIRLIVIDSIAFLFRDGEKRTIERTSQIFTLLQQLDSLARNYSLSVVITNQITTRIDENGCASIIPAMGDTFPSRINIRILLGTEGNFTSHQHAAVLIKSNSQEENSTIFKITKEGIRDCG